MSPTRVIIDTDPGIDDALALILAFASPELKVEAITTVAGNVPVIQAARNTCRILDLLEPDLRPPVAVGADAPLKKLLRTAQDYHGEDGLGELSRFKKSDGSLRYADSKSSLARQGALTLIADTIASAPGEITLICLGPLTNLAMAILSSPVEMAKVKEIIVMGGAIQVPGNVTPVSEFNIYVDPHAAATALTSDLPITLIPLDVTERVMLTEEMVDVIIRRLNNPVTQFVHDITEQLFRLERERRGRAAIPLHDPLAVGAVIDRSLVTRRPFHVEVETGEGPAQGITIADRRQIKEELKQAPNLQVCMEVNAGRFMALFLERICRPPA